MFFENFSLYIQKIELFIFLPYLLFVFYSIWFFKLYWSVIYKSHIHLMYPSWVWTYTYTHDTFTTTNVLNIFISSKNFLVFFDGFCFLFFCRSINHEIDRICSPPHARQGGPSSLSCGNLCGRFCSGWEGFEHCSPACRADLRVCAHSGLGGLCPRVWPAGWEDLGRHPSLWIWLWEAQWLIRVASFLPVAVKIKWDIVCKVPTIEPDVTGAQ